MSPRVIDTLVTVGPSLFDDGLAVSAVTDLMHRAQVDQALLVAARPPGYQLGPGNDLVRAAVAAESDRFLGLARIDPHQDDATNTLDHALTNGMRGLFLHPQQEVFQITDRRVDALARCCADHKRPIVIASGYPWLSEALQIGELAGRHPDVTFVMTNGGQFNISGLGQYDVELALAAHDNLLIQTSGVYRQDFIERTVNQFGAHRVMFASASPLFDAVYETLRIRLSRLERADKDAVLGATAQRVFGTVESLPA